jgi:hypothetical protein
MISVTWTIPISNHVIPFIHIPIPVTAAQEYRSVIAPIRPVELPG